MIAALEGADEAVSEEGQAFGVWAENWEIVTAFAGIDTQWRTVSLSTMSSARILYIGLDYTAVRMALGAERIRVTPELWAGIRVMEAASMSERNRAE